VLSRGVTPQTGMEKYPISYESNMIAVDPLMSNHGLHGVMISANALLLQAEILPS
jgi:hypothetical protein